MKTLYSADPLFIFVFLPLFIALGVSTIPASCVSERFVVAFCPPHGARALKEV